MLQFPCRCGNLFFLDDDQGGSSVQCTKCGLLNDVPLPGEVPLLAEDGTYKLDERPCDPTPRRAVRLSNLAHDFDIDRDDSDHSEIDLRLTPEEIAAVGAPPARRAAPRYDPETGELIRPLELAIQRSKVPAAAEIPFAQPAVTYSNKAPLPVESASRAIGVLGMPVNALVIAIVFGVQVFICLGIIFTAVTGLLIATGFLLIVQLFLIAHFGNVIDEAGVEERDDLPRLLRDLQFHEDIWNPLIGMLGGTFLCYAPALICGMAASMSRSAFLATSDALFILAAVLGVCIVINSVLGDGITDIDWTGAVIQPLALVLVAMAASFTPAGIGVAIGASMSVFLVVGLILAIAGTWFLPGALLTMVTSGSVLNLRPDRLLKTIGLCGKRYFSTLLAWIIGTTSYGLGITILALGVSSLVTGFTTHTWLDHMLLGYPLLCLGVIVMHYFSFEVGILYRRHHESFPWLFQRHHAVNHVRRSAAIRSATRARTTAVKNLPRRG